MCVCVCLNERMCVCILCGCGRLSLIHVYFTEYDLSPVTGVTREAGNAYSSGAPGSTSFARSSLLYWVFTGWILIFYSCCLFNDL